MFRSSTSDAIQHGYAILRLTVDERKDETVPVGVVAWDAEKKWFGTRSLHEDEAVSGVRRSYRTLLNVALDQLDTWASEKHVPYESASVSPTTAHFWRAASEIMSTGVRLDAPKSMEPMDDPDDELESLFEVVVQPRQTSRHRAMRIDGAISRALGSLADSIPARTVVQAYKGAEETVKRGSIGSRGVLLIDGVNLASGNARDDADALVSRFQRIESAYSEGVSMVIGYMASPGGLNGEAHMRDWIKDQLTTEVFDLARESEEFQEAAARGLIEVGFNDQPDLL